MQTSLEAHEMVVGSEHLYVRPGRPLKVKLSQNSSPGNPSLKPLPALSLVPVLCRRMKQTLC